MHRQGVHWILNRSKLSSLNCTEIYQKVCCENFFIYWRSKYRKLVRLISILNCIEVEEKQKWVQYSNCASHIYQMWIKCQDSWPSLIQALPPCPAPHDGGSSNQSGHHWQEVRRGGGLSQCYQCFLRVGDKDVIYLEWHNLMYFVISGGGLVD